MMKAHNVTDGCILKCGMSYEVEYWNLVIACLFRTGPRTA
jgi:hypothetical protein